MVATAKSEFSRWGSVEGLGLVWEVGRFNGSRFIYAALEQYPQKIEAPSIPEPDLVEKEQKPAKSF